MTEQLVIPSEQAAGKVVKALGNLLHVEYEGEIRQGEIAFVQVGKSSLKAEVIEIVGNRAKLQVFEDTKGVKWHTPVTFTGDLLEAELGPGLLSSIVDGLQNPLEELANVSGLFLPRGVYLPALDRRKAWDFNPVVKEGQIVSAGDSLGSTMEGRFHHWVMVPFQLREEITLNWVIQPGSYTVDTVIARGIDSTGKEHHFTMIQKWPIKKPLAFGSKIRPSKMMVTGMRIIDTEFPVLQGGAFCSPGPFGAGKTVLQHHLSKYSDVDIVIICACGERAGEVVEVLRTFPHLMDPRTSEPLINRTVIICNTSSMPVASREASIYLGATIAEYYRQMGLNILLLADSTSRWAQAMREMSGRLEEIPGEEAFPPYLGSRIAEFYERAGVLELKSGKVGSLTIGGSVSPAGGNFEEPVTQATLAVVGAFLGLSRGRSDARRYPAIDPLISWSKYREIVGKEMESQLSGWAKGVITAHALLVEADNIGKRMEVVGEEGISPADMVTYLKGDLFDFCYLQQNAFDKEDTCCPLKRQVPLFRLFITIFGAELKFSSHDEARSFFLGLQSDFKNMHSLPLDSAMYGQMYARIEEKVESVMRRVV